MTDQRYDLSYRGLLATGAEADEVRRRLGVIFRLNEAGLDRLFTGKPVIVKRDVDAATAAQFERLFAQAGAELTVVSVGAAAPGTHLGGDGPSPPLRIDTPALSLAPLGGLLEEPPPSVAPELDISYLSLVPGDDWTLEDCEPLPTPIPLPDLSYLSLVPLTEAEPNTRRASTG